MRALFRPRSVCHRRSLCAIASMRQPLAPFSLLSLLLLLLFTVFSDRCEITMMIKKRRMIGTEKTASVKLLLLQRDLFTTRRVINRRDGQRRNYRSLRRLDDLYFISSKIRWKARSPRSSDLPRWQSLEASTCGATRREEFVGKHCFTICHRAQLWRFDAFWHCDIWHYITTGARGWDMRLSAVITRGPWIMYTKMNRQHSKMRIESQL